MALEFKSRCNYRG